MINKNKEERKKRWNWKKYVALIENFSGELYL